ncbi:MAG: SRPBCC family protein [Mycobacterium sp.]
MELVNEFRVPVSVDQAWAVLTDVERVAPCIPGAQLLSVDGDDFTGVVKVKVGPITVQYKGKAAFDERDAGARRAVITASGKETRGQGHASAIVTAELKDEGDSTSCVLTTDLTISGKAAQFGRGVLSDVATKLIGQFAERLEADVLASAAPPGASEMPQPQAVSATSQPDAVNLLSLVAVPLAKRHVPPVGAGMILGIVIGYLLGRRRS